MEKTLNIKHKPNAEQMKNIVISVLEENKAEEIVDIDLAGKADFADYMVVTTAMSARHATSLADKVMDKLKAEGVVPLHAEGITDAEWVLIDANDVIVHIFLPHTRQLYNLEELWGTIPPSRI